MSKVRICSSVFLPLSILEAPLGIFPKFSAQIGVCSRVPCEYTPPLQLSVDIITKLVTIGRQYYCLPTEVWNIEYTAPKPTEKYNMYEPLRSVFTLAKSNHKYCGLTRLYQRPKKAKTISGVLKFFRKAGRLLPAGYFCYRYQ